MDCLCPYGLSLSNSQISYDQNTPCFFLQAKAKSKGWIWRILKFGAFSG
ncbi:hypothetical protein MANES_15G121950v8 [Manihot esculenta]|uniref:Uncharacterized protein n=1 Tax=Manihot esculenta TaxID=3983 RepID=A0ACB7GC99_MANES|nr:hypothetical protein MANES_15G121950v8 [Manihot esculenta]